MQQNFQNCDFIFGSVAEIERVWSLCGNVLTNKRNNLTPIMLEAILFLQVNERLCDVETVHMAYQQQKSSRSQNLVDEEEELEEMNNL